VVTRLSKGCIDGNTKLHNKLVQKPMQGLAEFRHCDEELANLAWSIAKCALPCK
jgi:hypothetical protein